MDMSFHGLSTGIDEVRARRLELAVLLAILFVALNMLDALLTTLAISHGSSEANMLAVSFGGDVALKALISTALAVPLMLGRWTRALALLCVGMSLVVAWNAVAIISWM